MTAYEFRPNRKPPPAPADKVKQPLQRRKPMKRISTERKALMKEVGPDRREFIKEFGRCQNQEPWAGEHFGALTVHEMTNGPNRERALRTRAALLVLCAGCNCSDFTDKKVWPLERQLALKLVVDPEFFDLGAINELLAPKGCENPPEVVTLAGVAKHLTLCGT